MNARLSGLRSHLTLCTESSDHTLHCESSLCIPQVLPPLKEAKVRPEIGTTIRNKLVRLMTHVDMGVKQGAAEFLFVLCKESGERGCGVGVLMPETLQREN